MMRVQVFRIEPTNDGLLPAQRYLFFEKLELFRSELVE